MKFTSALVLLSAALANGSNLRTPERKLDSSSSDDSQCLEANMEGIAGAGFDDIEGHVTVCFDGALSDTSGNLVMSVDGLEEKIRDGGVHIHGGTSCENAVTQKGHYFLGAPDDKENDPWFNSKNKDIAPQGTSYKTDKDGAGSADFQFDQGIGYDDTVGKVIVIHQSFDGGYKRIGCGVLEATN